MDFSITRAVLFLAALFTFSIGFADTRLPSCPVQGDFQTDESGEEAGEESGGETGTVEEEPDC